MKLTTLDFESFWSQTHSLSKMPAPNYVMHKDTELQSVAIKHGDGETFILWGEQDMQDWAAHTDFSDTLLIGHNMSGFDCMIAAWRLGIKPKAWGCTLAMARPIHARAAGGSLRALSEFYELEAKGSTLVDTKGKRLNQFTEQERRNMEVYNKRDTDNCYDILLRLLPKTSKREMRLIDHTIRMTTEPQFELDMRLLRYTLSQEESRKRRVLLDLGHALDPTRFLRDNDGIDITKKELSSAAKFKKMLQQWDVEVPMKPSPSDPEKQIPALAKTDEGMRGLLEHPNELVSGAAQARLDVKSTILETRLQRFIDIGEVCGGQMPVFLNYYGAVTGRWSGAQALNQQNPPRVYPGAPQLSDALRASWKAPKGYKVVSVDLSGIELRVNHFLWQVPSSMQLYQESPDEADLYVEFAAKHMYGIAEEDVTKDQRFVGKVAHLALGYNGGAKTFQAFARNYGKEIDLIKAQTIVTTWRDAYPEIVAGWRKCQGLMRLVTVTKDYNKALDPWGMCRTHKEGIKTPLGLIRYPNMRTETKVVDDEPRTQWVYSQGRNKTYIYGGKICNNICQHLAREVISDHLLAFAKTPLGKKYPPAHMVHDELIYVVREEDAQDVLDEVNGIMRGGVSWWPELITSSEGAIGDNYAETH